MNALGSDKVPEPLDQRLARVQDEWARKSLLDDEDHRRFVAAFRDAAAQNQNNQVQAQVEVARINATKDVQVETMRAAREDAARAHERELERLRLAAVPPKPGFWSDPHTVLAVVALAGTALAWLFKNFSFKGARRGAADRPRRNPRKARRHYVKKVRHVRKGKRVDWAKFVEVMKRRKPLRFLKTG